MEDQSAINDKIDYLASVVTKIMIQNDVKNTQALAKEIRKAWQTIEETQEFGLLLNARQKLFKIPVEPFETLARLVKDFEPYKSFWLTAAGSAFVFFIS